MKNRFKICLLKKIRICCLMSFCFSMFFAVGTAFAGEQAMPTLVAGGDWYKFSVSKSNIQSIEFRDSYIPDGTEVDVANADVEDKGEIKVYLLSGRKRVIISGNGSGGIIANENCSGMFSDMVGLTEVLNFQFLSTSNTIDMDSMFLECIVLEHIVFSAFDTSSVTSMCSMFKNCSCIESLDLSSWDLSHVKDTSYMFFNCAALEEITFPQMASTSIENMSYMFAECYELKDTDFSGLKTNKATNMTALFRNCVSLQDPDLSFLETQKLTNGYLMFEGCTGLRELDMHPLDVGGIQGSTAIDFFGTTVYPNLKKFTPPVNVCIDAPMPNPGNCEFYSSGEVLTLIPRNGINGASFEVQCQVTIRSDNETADDSYRVKRGTQIQAPEDPVREPDDTGTYTFGGWYIGEAPCDFSMHINEDTIITACWEFTLNQNGTDPEDPENGGSENGGSGNGGSGNGNSSGGGSGGSSSGGGSSGGGSGGSSNGFTFTSSGSGPSGVTVALAGTVTFSPFWYADTAGNWRIKDKAGKQVTSAWLCDDVIQNNGKNVWYLINADGTMVANGLVQDRTGNYYSLETMHNGYFGMLRYKNGFYKCGSETLFITFNHDHNGSFGAITSSDALEALKRIYGVTQFPVGNENIRYTASF